MAASSNATNPYLLLQQDMSKWFSPTLTPGFEKRIDGLFGLLTYLVLVSIVLFYFTIRRARSATNPAWMFRIVSRPQGRYFTTNQYFIAPLGTFCAGVVWIGYLTIIRGWWVNGKISSQVVYWVSLNFLPPLIVGWTTTFSVLGNANLSSTRKSDLTQHIVGPRLMNSVLFIVFPLSLVPIFVTSARTGQAYKALYHGWVAVYTAVGEEALSYNGNLTPDQIEAMMSSLRAGVATQLHPFAVELAKRYRLSAILFVVNLAVLLLLNIAGGVMLLSSLRVTGKNSFNSYNPPLVARLGPLAKPAQVVLRFARPGRFSGTPILVPEATVTQNDWYNDQGLAKDEAAGYGIRNGRRLDWDITLLYFSVPPACLVFGTYGVWLAIEAGRSAFNNGPKLEVACLAVEWAGAAGSCAALTAICTKRIVQVGRPPTGVPWIFEEGGPQRWDKQDTFSGKQMTQLEEDMVVEVGEVDLQPNHLALEPKKSMESVQVQELV